MRHTLIVKHSKDRHGAPLAMVHGLPGEGAELNAAQLRALAATLDRIADECDHGRGQHLTQTIVYAVHDAPPEHIPPGA